jgi:integrase
MTQDDRRQVLKKELLVSAFAPLTVQRYERALELFLVWCGGDGRSSVGKATKLDEVMADYVLFLFESGMSRSRAEMAIGGICMLLPEMKETWTQSSALLKGWRRKVPAVQYPPLTYDAVVLIVRSLVLAKESVAAIGVLLAFDCLLRISELLRLRKKDVARASDGRLGAESKQMVLNLGKTKNGLNQSVIVLDTTVQKLVTWRLEQLKDDDAHLFPWSSDGFRQVFKKAVADAGLTEDFVPHSLRHGGATRMFLAGTKVEDIVARGRWASMKSASRYIQGGRSLLLQQQMDRSLGARAALWRPLLFQVITER